MYGSNSYSWGVGRRSTTTSHHSPRAIGHSRSQDVRAAPIAGKVIAEALLGDTTRLEAFRSIPRRETFGALGKVAAEVYYRTSQIKDKIKEIVT